MTEENGKLIISYSALSRIEAGIIDNKLSVDTMSNPNVTDEEILETNKRFRKFLNDATGYTSKQRRNMAKKEVQEIS